MTTQICTLEQHSTLTMPLTPRKGCCLHDSFDVIAVIFQRYREWDDPLSKQLTHIFNLGVELFNDSPSQEQLIATLNELKETLKNPLTDSPFYDPWIYENIIIEKVYLDRVIAARNSIILGYIEAKSHDFAKEVILWLDSLNIFDTKIESRMTPYAIPMTAELAKAELESFVSVRQLILQIYREQESNIKLQELNIEQHCELNKVHNELSQYFHKLNQKVDESCQSNAKELEEIKSKYQATEEVIVNRLEEQGKRLNEAREKVIALDHALKNEQAKSQELNNEVNRLRNEIGGNSCTLL